MPQETKTDETISRETTADKPTEQSPALKIKQEKIDPEIENKINNLCANNNNINETEQNSNDDVQTSDDEENEEDSDSESSQEHDEDAEQEEDEKKTIEPVKSSNEILMELFNVFNAAPPEELLDDKNLIEKTRKRKKEKKKKHKKSKSDGECSVPETETGSQGKHKKKKKHKHKHKDGEKSKEKKKSKDKTKDKVKSKGKKSKDKDKLKDNENSKDRDAGKLVNIKEEKDLSHKDIIGRKSGGSSDRKRHHEKETKSNGGHKRSKLEDKDSKHQSNPFYSSSSRDKEIKKEPHSDKEKYYKNGGKIEIKIKKNFREFGYRNTSDGEISEISLSDEESYLRGKEKQSDYSKYKSRNSFYANTDRSRSREGDRTHNKDRHQAQDKDRDREDSRHHHRSRGDGGRGYRSRHSKSRSRSRSRDLGIDKKRLLEIARKNAITMFKRGNLPGCANMTEDVKDRVLLKMRYGGRTVEDLTEFCKKISNGEHLSDLSSDEGSDVDKSGNVKAFHHPFQLKEREPIVMHIRNSKPIVPVFKTSEDTKTITMQFPVSSGQQHRMTEAWVPVEAKDKLPPLPALPAVTQSTSIFKAAIAKNALGKSLPTEGEQEPAFKPVVETAATPSPEREKTLQNTEIAPTTENIPASQPAPQPVPPPFQTSGVPPVPTPVPPPPTAVAPVPPPTTVSAVANCFVPDVPVPSSMYSIFPQSSATALDVSTIISKRLNAMRRLQENPMDSEALKLMYNSQKEMSSWAASKHMPGQFTGSTGANILKPNELNSGTQVWAKKNQLTSLKPVTGGMGMHLLQKMGWRPGEGLGREKNGSLQPLLLDVKLDKRGLVAQEDHRQPKKRSHAHNATPPNQSLQDKHPVCLLNELTTKYKWTPPLYTLVHENGPSHSRMFLFSVQVNNETYAPSKLSNTKKDAKFAAAKLCLQQLGILPPG